MSLSFPALLILLLPGFFSLWVYQGLALEDIHRRGEAHVVAIGLMFGLLNLGVWTLVDCLFCANLTIRFDEDVASLMQWAFVWRYALLSVLALVIGGSCGVLTRSRLGSPVWWFRNLSSKILKVNPTTSNESALNYALQEMSKNDTPLLVGVSEYDGGPFKVLGWYHANSFEPRELALIDTHLFRGLAGKELQFVRSRPASSVVLDSGLIITIMPLSVEQRNDLTDSLKRRRKAIMDNPSFYR